MARPVVATAVGGNPHVINDSETGFLVDYPDSIALARRIVALLGAPVERRRVGAAARLRVLDAFSARSMVRQIEALYDRLLDDQAPTRAASPAR